MEGCRAEGNSSRPMAFIIDRRVQNLHTEYTEYTIFAGFANLMSSPEEIQNVDGMEEGATVMDLGALLEFVLLTVLVEVMSIKEGNQTLWNAIFNWARVTPCIVVEDPKMAAPDILRQWSF